MTLDDVREIATALPDVAETPHFALTSFRVGGKIIATAEPDGDFVRIFVGEEDRQRALALDPANCETLSWGGRVVGLTVRLPRADEHLVANLVEQAWRGKAPKRDVDKFDAEKGD